MSLRGRILRLFAGSRAALQTWTGKRRRKFGERREVVERKRSSTWQVAVALLAVTLGSAGLGYLAVQLFFLPETVAQSRLNRVPDLTGRDVEYAFQAGEDVGYVVIESGGQFSDEVDAGEILYQIPPPDTYLQRGDTLWVLTSLGESTPVIPDLSGVEPGIARRVLARLGLEITADRRAPSDLHPQGTVVETVPPAGTPIQEDTRATLVLSRGGSFLEMPDVTNLPLAAARDSLESFGLTIGEVTEVGEEQSVGEASVVVVSQDPAPYRRVRAGSAVRLHLGERERRPAGPPARPPEELRVPADANEEGVVEQPGAAERRQIEEDRRRREAEREREPAEQGERREARPLDVPDEPADEPSAPRDDDP